MLLGQFRLILRVGQKSGPELQRVCDADATGDRRNRHGRMFSAVGAIRHKCDDSRIRLASAVPHCTRQRFPPLSAGKIPPRVVAKRIPTKIGDVLILETDWAFEIYVVGRVTKDGQQDFHGQKDAQYISDGAAAKAAAKTLVVPGRRIFVRNIDTDDWSEIPDEIAKKGNP